jgi:hypothetical protein
VHDLDPGECHGGGPEGFEPKHRSRLSLDGPVILLNDVVEVFDLAHLDAGLGLGAVLAPLLSIVTFSGVPLLPMALRRKRSGTLQSRLAVSRKSTVAPALSTARYRYFQTPLTFA